MSRSATIKKALTFWNNRVLSWLLLSCLLAYSGSAALPQRLVLAVDGISFDDVRQLQQRARPATRRAPRAFTNGFFPASRLVSTFPSTTDCAWTEIFGNGALPGYQRTYFDREANRMVFVNGVTSSIEFERQMTWRMQGGFAHAMSYLFPRLVFSCELRDLEKRFLEATNSPATFYAYLSSTDAAQHMGCDIRNLLLKVDQQLERLRSICQSREGRDLEILVLSDHGNDHAGHGRRVGVRKLLLHAGYHLCASIGSSRDLVLPTVGIESWVEIHNLPSQTERLLALLTTLEGADILTALDPALENRFIVLDRLGRRAVIDYQPVSNVIRYTLQTGDPLGYAGLLNELRRNHELDPDGFGTTDAWMRRSTGHKYPLALERIVRAHTRETLNPATILISLKGGYVHAGWGVHAGSALMPSGGTHGSLEAASSVGVLLSTFAQTSDSSTARVAALFNHFPGLHQPPQQLAKTEP